MRRRTLLAALGTLGSLSGCAAPGSGPRYEGLAPEQSPGERFDPDEVQRRVELAGVDSMPDGVDLSIGATLLDGEVTGEETARVRVETTNGGRELFAPGRAGGCSLFNRNRGESEDGGLWLVRQGFPGMRFYGEGEKRVDPLWAVRTDDDDGPPPGIVFEGYGCATRYYAPGDSVAHEYRLWDGWRAPGYLPPGVHRFEREIELQSVDRTDEGDRAVPGETLASFTWGLELRVTDPGE